MTLSIGNGRPIRGFALAEYRNFGAEMQFLPSLGKVNVIVGRNNAGKSTILRFANNMLRKRDVVVEQIDYPFADSTRNGPQLAISVGTCEIVCDYLRDAN